MKDDLSRSFCYWAHDGEAIFQLGCDDIGKQYFLKLGDEDYLLETQIGFRIKIVYEEVGPTAPFFPGPPEASIKMEKIVLDEVDISKFQHAMDKHSVSIIKNKDAGSVCLELDEFIGTKMELHKQSENLSILRIEFANAFTKPLPTKEDLKEFFAGINWHK